MRHKLTISLTAALVLGVAVSWPRISFFFLTGHFSPIQKIDVLQNTILVTKWSSDGLHLADGRTVQLPGLRSLPSDSPALAEATKRGVDVREDGRVWGLVRVHHWCGNDPVREHIARVDLSDMMTFLRVGAPIADVPASESLATEAGGRFTKWGWSVGEFFQFQSWQGSRIHRDDGNY